MIPNDIEKRTKLNKYIEQSVALMREQDTLKEDLSEIKEMVKAEVGKEFVKSFSNQVKARYDEAKLLEQVKDIEEAVEDHRILKGE